MAGTPSPGGSSNGSGSIGPAPRWKRWLRITVGWSFIVLGLIGLILPILQGILFLAIGFAILARDYPWAQQQLDRLRRRYPQMAATFDQAADRAKTWLDRLNNRPSI